MSESQERKNPATGRVYDARASLSEFVQDFNVPVGEIIEFTGAETASVYERNSKVRIDRIVAPLGWGYFSKYVAEVEASVALGNDEYSPRHNFVIKQFNDAKQLIDGQLTLDAKSKAEDCFRSWQMLRELGLRTWQTFRINPERGMALMTSGNLDGKLAIMPNNENFITKIRGVENFKISEEIFGSLIESMISEIKKANGFGVFVNTDAYTFIVSVDSGNLKDVDFVLGDLDWVFRPEDRGDAEKYKLGISNLSKLRKSLRMFVYEYVLPSDRTTFSKIIDEKFRPLHIPFDPDGLEDELGDGEELL